MPERRGHRWGAIALNRALEGLPLVVMAGLTALTYWLVQTNVVPGTRTAAPIEHKPDYSLIDFTVRSFDATGRPRTDIAGQRADHYPDTGILDVFVNEMHVAYREATIGQRGLMLGRDLANAFSSLRPNDLVWNYVVGNYLKGEKPPAFDLLYWNGDSTNMPGPMYCWYLRHCYLQDDLKKPDLLTVCGEKLDLSRVDVPVFIYGSRDDHIVPWAAAYASTGILSGKKTFVLGASGHIAGVVNPPAKKKRSHWTNAKLPADSGAWLAGAIEHPGSWWPRWSAWLAGHGGKRVAAPRKPGNARYKPIEPAPGRYVLVKA